ncbi:MAG: AAA family ATPase, partial [Armatimonadia bacterium]
MYLRRLALHNFRVYESLQLELTSGLTVFIGPNAAGKTSLLEAMYLLAATKSPR